MRRITIFTPTFNRAYTIEKTYKSLLSQTCKDFVWMIVDDGSTDNTKEMVEEWIQDNKIHIEYYYKKNGGKHSAYNFAVKHVSTDLIMISLDSDDYLTDNAIETFLTTWESENENGDYIGIVGLCNDKSSSGKYEISYNIDNLRGMSLEEGLVSGEFNASAIFVFKSSYLKSYMYPEIDGEKFFSEAYTYYQMTGKMIWTKNYVCIREFREDGLTKNTYKLYIHNPKSWFMYNSLRAKKTKKIINKMKYITFANMFGMMANENYIKMSENKILSVLLMPLALLVKKYIYVKGKNK